MCSRACHSGAYSIDVDADACLSVTKKRLYCRRQCHVATIYLNNTAPDHYQHRRYLTFYISPFKSKFQNEIAQRDTNGMKKIPASGEVSTKNECQPPSKCTFFFVCLFCCIRLRATPTLSLYISSSSTPLWHRQQFTLSIRRVLPISPSTRWNEKKVKIACGVRSSTELRSCAHQPMFLIYVHILRST